MQRKGEGAEGDWCRGRGKELRGTGAEEGGKS